MIRNIADEITLMLVHKGIVDYSRRDYYRYGAEVLLLNVIIMSIVLCITVITGTWWHFLWFLVIFVPLRTFIGGYHAKNSETCLLISTLMYLGTVGIYHYFPNIYKNKIAVYILLMITIMIFIKAPVIHKNNILDRKTFRRNKIISKILAILDSMIFIILAVMQIDGATSVMIFIAIAGGLMREEETKASE